MVCKVRQPTLCHRGGLWQYLAGMINLFYYNPLPKKKLYGSTYRSKPSTALYSSTKAKILMPPHIIILHTQYLLEMSQCREETCFESLVFLTCKVGLKSLQVVVVKSITQRSCYSDSTRKSVKSKFVLDIARTYRPPNFHSNRYNSARVDIKRHIKTLS